MWTTRRRNYDSGLVMTPTKYLTTLSLADNSQSQNNNSGLPFFHPLDIEEMFFGPPMTVSGVLGWEVCHRKPVKGAIGWHLTFYSAIRWQPVFYSPIGWHLIFYSAIGWHLVFYRAIGRHLIFYIVCNCPTLARTVPELYCMSAQCYVHSVSSAKQHSCSHILTSIPHSSNIMIPYIRHEGVM